MSHDLPPHNSPQDRGSADAYYGRQFNPHKISGSMRLVLTDEKEIEEYTFGFNNEADRKVYA